MSASIIPPPPRVQPLTVSLSVTLSLRLSLYFSLVLSFSRISSLFSILCWGVASILPVVQHTSLSLSFCLALSRNLCFPLFLSLSLSLVTVLCPLLFSYAFSLSASPSDHSRAPDECFSPPVVPTGHAARLFSSHLLCKRTQSRLVTPARPLLLFLFLSFSFSCRLSRNLRPRQRDLRRILVPEQQT